MEPLHRSLGRDERADLFRAQRDDHIGLGERDVVQALGVMVGDVDAILGERADGERIQRSGMGTCTEESVAPSRGRQCAREPFRHLAARRIGDAQEENRLQVPISSAWCLMLLPSTRNTTSSAMFVARSATRSRLRLTRNKSIAAPMMCGSSIMCVSRIRNID